MTEGNLGYIVYKGIKPMVTSVNPTPIRTAVIIYILLSENDLIIYCPTQNKNIHIEVKSLGYIMGYLHGFIVYNDCLLDFWV